MYKLILSLNTRLKRTAKSCPQSGDGLAHTLSIAFRHLPLTCIFIA